MIRRCQLEDRGNKTVHCYTCKSNAANTDPDTIYANKLVDDTCCEVLELTRTCAIFGHETKPPIEIGLGIDIRRNISINMC